MATQNQLFMRRAKHMLEGNWGYAVLGTLIYFALMGLASLSYFAELIIYGPMTVGYFLYIMVICDFRRPDLNMLFKGFDHFVQTLVAGLLLSLALTFGLILLIVPGIIVGLGFSMTFFIMNENPDMYGVDALQASWEMMRGNKWRAFCLSLRFFGWWILCLLTLGIGFLWLYPYMVASMLNFYRDLKLRQAKGIPGSW